MANRVQRRYRVTAWPIHARYPFPRSAAWGVTDFPADYAESHLTNAFGKSEYASIDAYGEMLTAKRITVPYNNFAEIGTAENGDPILDESDADTYYNHSHPSMAWRVRRLGEYMERPEYESTPWRTLTAGAEKSRAMVYRFHETVISDPEVRRDYIPSNNKWVFRTLAPYSLAADPDTPLNVIGQGFNFNVGIKFDPRWTIWTKDENNNWKSQVLFQPGEPTPFWELLIQFYGDTDPGSCNALTYRFVFEYGSRQAQVYRGYGYQNYEVDHDPDDPEVPPVCSYPEGWSPKWIPVKTWDLSTGATEQEDTTDHGYKGYYSGFAKPDAPKKIEVIYLGGRLKITYGDSTPLILEVERDRYSATVWRIRGVEFSGQGAREVDFALIPIKWNPFVSFKSRRIPVGFTPSPEAPIRRSVQWGHTYSDGTPVYSPSSYSFTLAPGEDPVNPDDPNDPDNQRSLSGEYLLYFAGDYQYQFEMTLPVHGVSGYGRTGIPKFWSHYTPVVKALTTEIDEVLYQPTGVPVQLYPERVTVTQTFDRNDLSMTSHAQLIFNNFYDLQTTHGLVAPQVYWGEFSNYAGAFGVDIDMAFEIQTPSGEVVHDTGWHRVFTGYANVQSVAHVGGGGQSQYVMQCFDRSLSLQMPVWSLPWMDGWNIYYAAAHLANRAGFKRGSPGNTDIAFRTYVPPTPQLDYGNPTTEDTYFLPLGTGSAPLQRYTPGLSVWSILGKLGQLSGHVRYVNVNGDFDFRKYRLLNATIPFRIFSIVDRTSPPGQVTSPRLATEVMNARIERDLLRTHNQVVLIGIPVTGGFAQNGTVTSAFDASGVYAPPNTMTAFDYTSANHIGFLRPMVWTDNIWAVEKPLENPTAYEKVAESAREILNVVKTPFLTLSLTTWLQPDIYPETRIGFFDRRTGGFDIVTGKYYEYMVTSVRHDISKNDSSTTLTCIYLPPFNNPFTPRTS